VGGKVTAQPHVSFDLQQTVEYPGMQGAHLLVLASVHEAPVELASLFCVQMPNKAQAPPWFVQSMHREPWKPQLATVFPLGSHAPLAVQHPAQFEDPQAASRASGGISTST
jgi:hypothetical protein